MLFRKHWFSRRNIFSLHTIVIFSFLTILVLVQSVHLHGRRTPIGSLTLEHVQNKKIAGGRWYIPPDWTRYSNGTQQDSSLAVNVSIWEAAEYAHELAVQRRAFLNHSHIPFITHQTWVDLDANSWSNLIRRRVERWLSVAAQPRNEMLTGPEMAWFLWDDDGIDALIKIYEPELHESFQRLPYPVEKADVFRVVVLKWFGGIYADVDAEPLTHPFDWIHEGDLLPWTGTKSHRAHSFPGVLEKPHLNMTEGSSYQDSVAPSAPSQANTQAEPSIRAIFGIEADNPPAPDPTYWRMGYTYPVQITNWALAMASQHPLADQFLHNLKSMVLNNSENLAAIDPLDITGPPALTTAIQVVAQQNDPGFSWDALSGRNIDPVGGRGKVIASDVLVLPITGFNPGRGWFQNMGSESITHPNARLRHAAAGTWRSVDLKVHWGKFCRQAFGLCKDWGKIPDRS